MERHSSSDLISVVLPSQPEVVIYLEAKPTDQASTWYAGRVVSSVIDDDTIASMKRYGAATRRIASKLRSTSASVVAHDDTLIRIAVLPCHTVGPAQHVPSS